MPLWNVVRKGVYHDSVTLMQLTRDLADANGVHRAAAMMGTFANRALLREAGLLTSDGEAAAPNDLIIAVEADEMAAAHGIVEAAEVALLTARSLPFTNLTARRPRTLRSALALLDGTNLAFISVPGIYAAWEAMKALQAGLHVMLFSDNVPVATEIALKRLALAKGLLMLGPDCGTAIINGIPLGFANVVPRGRIGLAAASGTGLQEVSCLISAAGEGISQAIGVGGRDLADEVGGLMMQQALDILASDPATAVVCMLGKPPGRKAWERLQTQLAHLSKPCVVHFAGLASGTDGRCYASATLEDTAEAAVALIRGVRPEPAEFTLPRTEIEPLIEHVTRTMGPGQRLVRGIYSGGTLAYEARSLLKAKLSQVSDGLSGAGEGHSVVDLGEDRFTLGRPHPMIDATLRCEWIHQAAQELSTAVILFDVILGYGAHPDPAGELVPTIRQAIRQAQAAGRHIALVASVCGTEQDPQRRSTQVDALRAQGVIVMPSNAQAARLAALIAARLAAKAS
jgi:succinyl-CoA synthetase alpha subunit